MLEEFERGQALGFQEEPEQFYVEEGDEEGSWLAKRAKCHQETLNPTP